jgi:NAD(P) transhydrogenase subunit alpha
VRVAVLNETSPGERRVALVPEIVEKLAAGGFEIDVEAGAGAAASFSDRKFEQAGASVVSTRADLLSRAEAVVKVQKPTAEEVELLPEGSILIALLQPLDDREGIERLARRGVLGFALESIPRITRAQPMDALSSQATVSGYKAVLIAANRLPRFFPMLMRKRRAGTRQSSPKRGASASKTSSSADYRSSTLSLRRR